jgi:3-methyladenine DNA glycosylase Mpg
MTRRRRCFCCFLQEIISGRPRKPAETLARAGRTTEKTAKKQRRQGKEQRKLVNGRPRLPLAANIVLAQPQI